MVNVDFSSSKGAQRGPLRNIKDKDGQDITFSFSIQYKLNKIGIPELYNRFKTNYEKTFISWIEFEVRNQVGKFNNTVFWEDRKNAGEKLKKAIGDKLAKEGDFATCEGIQFLNVQLNRAKEKELITTQIQKQRLLTNRKIQ